MCSEIVKVRIPPFIILIVARTRASCACGYLIAAFFAKAPISHIYLIPARLLISSPGDPSRYLQLQPNTSVPVVMSPTPSDTVVWDGSSVDESAEERGGHWRGPPSCLAESAELRTCPPSLITNVTERSRRAGYEWSSSSSACLNLSFSTWKFSNPIGK